MNTLDLEQLLDRIVARRLEPLQRLVEQALRQRDTLTPAQRAVLQAVVRLYKPGDIVVAAGLVDAARFDPEARDALREHLGGDVQRIGIALGQVADAGAVLAGLRLVRLPKEAGVRRWVLEAVESL